MMILLALCLSDVNWEITNTEIYIPLLDDEVIVSPAGEVYILDYPQAVVHHFSENGTKLPDIGVRGNGPGEFQAPWTIFLEGPSLYVFDRRTDAISEFVGGVFKRSMSIPKRGVFMVKVRSGWLHGDWLHSRPGLPANVVHVDADFANPRTVLQLAERGKTDALNIELVDGKRVGFFTPVGSTPMLKASPDGRYAYILEANGLRVHVYDVARGNLRVLEGNQRPVPFDLQWARAIEREHEQTFGVEVRGDYPDYFPIVRDFLITHDGNLAFDRWRGNPEANHHPLLLSPTGAELPSQQWETYPRTIAVRNGQAYVSGFDEGGGEAYISRMPLAAVPTFIRENPIEFDGNTFRTFNRQ